LVNLRVQPCGHAVGLVGVTRDYAFVLDDQDWERAGHLTAALQKQGQLDAAAGGATQSHRRGSLEIIQHRQQPLPGGLDAQGGAGVRHGAAPEGAEEVVVPQVSRQG
jgi:hypothetical protein